MRSALALAALIAFATAAPLEMAADGKYTKYGIYASYRPYTTYGKYPTAAAADAEAATMQFGIYHTLEDAPPKSHAKVSDELAQKHVWGAPKLGAKLKTWTW